MMGLSLFTGWRCRILVFFALFFYRHFLICFHGSLCVLAVSVHQTGHMAQINKKKVEIVPESLEEVIESTGPGLWLGEDERDDPLLGPSIWHYFYDEKFLDEQKEQEVIKRPDNPAAFLQASNDAGAGNLGSYFDFTAPDKDDYPYACLCDPNEFAQWQVNRNKLVKCKNFIDRNNTSHMAYCNPLTDPLYNA